MMNAPNTTALRLILTGFVSLELYLCRLEQRNTMLRCYRTAPWTQTWIALFAPGLS